MRKASKVALGVCLGYLVLSAIAGMVVAEASLKLGRRPLQHRREIAAFVRQHYDTELEEVSVQAADGATLRGWYVRPQEFNGNAVILLHGITDNREGVAGYGKLFLDHGYAVLLPDARRHGESGGDLATYGLKESDDIHRWVDWLYASAPPSPQHAQQRRVPGAPPSPQHTQQRRVPGAPGGEIAAPGCVYGFGESYGAALMLESLAVESRYCGVAVESSFSTAREMSYERVSGPLHLKPWFGKTVGLPVIASAVVYARVRYGIDLLAPSPLEALKHSRVPVLLIHGAKDRSISPQHALILAKADPGHAELWLVPNAGHTMAWAASHQEFEDRVLGWFSLHPRTPALVNQ